MPLRAGVDPFPVGHVANSYAGHLLEDVCVCE